MSKQATVDESKARELHEQLEPYAEDMFRVMGYEKPSATMVRMYREFKRRKDRIHPGRMTPGEFALVAYLADLQDGVASEKDGGE